MSGAGILGDFQRYFPEYGIADAMTSTAREPDKLIHRNQRSIHRQTPAGVSGNLIGMGFTKETKFREESVQ